MYDNTRTILAEAHADAMARSAFHDDSPPDPDAPHREAIDGIAAMAPSVKTAASLLNAAAVRPVPLDRESMEATGEPLATLSEVAEHWRRSPADGCGLRAGVQVNGSSVFAIRGTVNRLRDWMADVGAETRDLVNEYGSVTSSTRTYLPVTPFATVRWAPPPAAPARSIVSFGAALLDGGRQLPGDKANDARALDSIGWLTWTVACVWTAPASSSGKRLQVRSHSIAKGVEMVGEGGLVPWHIRRGNGWVCSGANLPIASDIALSPWLAAAIGGKWRAVR